MNTAAIAHPAAARRPLGLLAFFRRLPQLMQLLRPGTASSAKEPLRPLDKGATVWVAHPLGRSVRCEAGTVWLTFDNEPADVVLEPGQSHHCAKDSKLAIHALADARVSVG